MVNEAFIQLINKTRFNIDVENLLWLPANIAVFWKNAEGYYLGGNDVTASSLHFNTRHDIEGRTDYDLPIRRIDAEALRKGDLLVLKTKQPNTFIHTCIVQNEIKHFIQLKAPLYDQSGKIVGVYGINHFVLNQYDGVIESNPNYRRDAILHNLFKRTV